MIDLTNYTYVKRAEFVKTVLSLSHKDTDLKALQSMELKKGDRSSGIYGIFNLETKGLYIGSTTDFHKRLIRHISDIKKCMSWRAINEDVKRFGPESFVFIKIHEVAPTFLVEAENYWMQSLKATYNKNKAYEMRIPIEAKRASKGNRIKTINHYSSPVIKKSLNGEIINEYNSIRAAAVEHGGKHLAYLITKVCRGKIDNALGYLWEYKNGLTPAKPKWVKSLIEKQVVQINSKTGDFIKIWDSSIDAAAFYGLKSHSIRRVANSDKEAGGFIWRYANINTFKTV